MRLPMLIQLFLTLLSPHSICGFVELSHQRCSVVSPRHSWSRLRRRSFERSSLLRGRITRRTLLCQQLDPQSAGGASTLEGKFDWTTEWYPVSPVCDLSTTRPNKVTLLGADFCVWYHSPSRTWQAFEDSCPHRRVPLSEGRIELVMEGVAAGAPQGAFLQCAYHGWEFAPNGTCVAIPQLSSACSPVSWPSACAKNFPAQVAQDLLWIFPSHDRPELATTKLPATIPQLDDNEKVDATALYCRDLPYSWETLVENLCDPTHVVYAHHGSMRGADRYAPPENKQVNLRVTSLDAAGFVAEKDPVPANGRYRVQFRPPCLLYYDIVNSRAMGTSLSDEQRSKIYIGLGSYCIPTGPGTSRLIARFPFYLPVKPVMYLMRNTPRWITHFSQNIVIDSDVVFLATQDDRLRPGVGRGEENGASPLKHYYLPTRSDAMVVAFRRWLQKFGGSPMSASGSLAQNAPAATRSGGEPTTWNRLPARAGRDKLLDRYRQHTEICSSCRDAHTRLSRWSRICTWGSFFSLLALAAAAPSHASSRATRLCLLAAVLLFAVPRIALRPLIQRLECVPWPRKEWLQSPDAATQRKIEVPL